MTRVDTRTTTKCRTGCPSQDHLSYADCCKGLRLNAGVARSFIQKSWDQELDAYRSARGQGIQPAGTTMDKVEEAFRISDATGVAYQADVNPYVG